MRVLREELEPAAILERPDPRMRELEGLAAPSLEPLFVADAATPRTSTQFRLNGLSFHYDANAGQKTGAFLDQRANYAAAAEWAQKLGGSEPDGRWTFAATRAGLRCTWPRFAARLRASTLRALRSKWRSGILRPIAPGLRRRWTGWRAMRLRFCATGRSSEKFDAIVLDPPAFAKTQASG